MGISTPFSEMYSKYIAKLATDNPQNTVQIHWSVMIADVNDAASGHGIAEDQAKNTMLCPIKVNSNTIEITCCCV